jgi:predicted nuclease of restriction endonuclease-like (RecB) superfamily
MSQVPHKDYQKILNDLKEKIRRSRLKAAMVVNHELLKIYWEIGNTILTQQKIEGWGAKIIDRLAADLKGEFPDFRGFSLRNLKYMRAFAEAYPDFLIVQVPLAQSEEINDPRDEFVQVPLAQITWYHHITLLDKVKDPIARLFYIHKTIANGWSRDVLVLQIESNLFERQGKAINNFSQTLPQPDSDLAIQTFKNPYVLDFLDLNESVKERDVERALIEHLKKFMLELGRGFSYVGNQFKLNVEEDDYFLDLLFYNYHLHRFILFELKIGEFKPEYIGKLNFYINTVNEQIRGLEDKTTIGILLCKTPNETVVKYSLENIKTPIGVANYKITNDLPRQLKGEIPSAKELEGVLNNKAENMEKPLEQKLNKIKQALRIKKSRD